MSTSWGPQSRPPGQAGAKEPRRLETGEARQLVRSLPWRCEGACLLVSVPGPQRPLGPAPGQTRLRASDRGTVGPDPRTPSWTRLVRNQGSCGHGPKAWVSRRRPALPRVRSSGTFSSPLSFRPARNRHIAPIRIRSQASGGSPGSDQRPGSLHPPRARGRQVPGVAVAGRRGVRAAADLPKKRRKCRRQWS